MVSLILFHWRHNVLSGKILVMIKTGTSFNSDVVYRTHDLIASAIRQDFSNTDISIGNYASYVFERDDPLGMAFYQFAISETNYKSQEISSNPEFWKSWLETRLNEEFPTPYIDTEISAMGLILYSLSRKGIYPSNADKFIELANKHFTSKDGLFGNYLATVLVGLGISRLENNAEELSKFEKYIDSQINNYKKNIFNDPKNLVITYLWGKEIENPKMREDVRLEAFRKYSEEQYLSRDIVYLAYILIEEITFFSRSERNGIKTFIEDSLNFIVDYTLEGKLQSNAIKEEYGNDIAFESPEQWEVYGYSSKPPLSRIILSLGFLIKQKYIDSPNIFNSLEQITKKISGLIAFSVMPLLLGSLFAYLWGTLSILDNFKDDFATKQLSGILTGLLKGSASTLLLVLAITLVIFAGIFAYNIWKDIEVNLTKSITNTLKVMPKIIWGDLFAGILINLLT